MHDQYTIIQHFLPKGYSLLEKKTGKRDKASGFKYGDNEVFFILYRTCRDSLEVSSILKKSREDQRETE